MPSPSRSRMQGAVRDARDNPLKSVEDLATDHTISRRMAEKIRSGEYDHVTDQEAASTVAVDPAPNPSGRFSLRPRRPARKQKRKLEEPEQEKVDSVYGLACMLSAVLLSPFPPHYQLTETDRQAIIAPLTRMYLRRQSVPDISPDGRDAVVLLTGLFGYATHAFGNHYVGRDAVRTYGRASSREAGHPAGPGTAPPPPVPEGVAGQPGPGQSNGNPFDPNEIMARLEEELRRGAAEGDGAAGAVPGAADGGGD